jgi:drug/metabolite transporter (DMT)-like permease
VALNAAGIALAFASAVANAFAVVLQAAEARSSPAHESGRFRLLLTLARRPRWLLGTGLIVAAWPLQVLALTLAPITVVQPMLASFQLILLVLARLTLHERVGYVEALGATVIVLGVALVVAAAPRHTIRHPPALRLALPLALVAAAALFAYWVARVRPRGGLPLVIGAGLGYAWVDFANKLLANETSQRHWALAVLCVIAIIGFGSLRARCAGCHRRRTRCWLTNFRRLTSRHRTFPAASRAIATGKVPAGWVFPSWPVPTRSASEHVIEVDSADMVGFPPNLYRT